jgi:hypothetical protein
MQFLERKGHFHKFVCDGPTPRNLSRIRMPSAPPAEVVEDPCLFRAVGWATRSVPTVNFSFGSMVGTLRFAHRTDPARTQRWLPTFSRKGEKVTAAYRQFGIT